MASAPPPNPTPPSPSSSTPQPNPPPTTKPFRFKRKHSTTSPNSSPHHRHRHHHHHHHRHHHRSHRPHHFSPPPSPPLDPDTAFRESLFDAMADDEGAAYWESVYGQPVHTYAHYYNNSSNNNMGSDADAQAKGEKGPNGAGKENVQTMTEDEYVTFVRRKMWERSYGYVFEERERRREEMRRDRNGNRDKRRKAEGENGGREYVGEKEKYEGRDWQRGVEEALMRGEERRRMKKREEGRWRVVWEGYVRGWEGMWWGGGREANDVSGLGEEEKTKGKTKTKSKGKNLRERMPWPVESGKWEDVEKDGVERFLSRAPTAAAAGGGIDKESRVRLDLGEVLKKERIRWHPDKMQQRAGEGGIDAETLKLVTAVFQVVDRMWGEVKGKKKTI